METLWLLTRAWNTGILLYSLAQYPEAEKWCGLAMSFIRHLGSLQESYETQVQDWWKGREGMKQTGVVVVQRFWPQKHTGLMLYQVSMQTFESQELFKLYSCFLCAHRCLVSTVKSWTGWTKPRRTSSWRSKPTGTGQLWSARG